MKNVLKYILTYILFFSLSLFLMFLYGVMFHHNGISFITAIITALVGTTGILAGYIIVDIKIGK